MPVSVSMADRIRLRRPIVSLTLFREDVASKKLFRSASGFAYSRSATKWSSSLVVTNDGGNTWVAGRPSIETVTLPEVPFASNVSHSGSGFGEETCGAAAGGSGGGG